MTSETDGETEQNLIGSCHFKQQNLNPATEPRLRSNSWPRKVFERVQYHVLDLLGRCNLVQSLPGPKLQIQTFWKWTKTAVWQEINFGKKWSCGELQYWSIFKLFESPFSVQIWRKTLGQNWTPEMCRNSSLATVTFLVTLFDFCRGGSFEPDGRFNIFKFLFNYFNHSYHIPTRKKRKWQILNAGIGRPPPVLRWRHFDNTTTTPVSLINLFIDKSLYLLWKGYWLLEKRGFAGID